jgi:predicted nucleic acid-binding protein
MIGLDTGFFVELLRANPVAVTVFDSIADGENDACVSCVTLYELKKLALKGHMPPEPTSSLVESLMTFCAVSWLDNIEVHDLAAGIAHSTGIPGLDCLILAGLISSHAGVIYTTHKHMTEYRPKDTRVLLIAPAHDQG